MRPFSKTRRAPESARPERPIRAYNCIGGARMGTADCKSYLDE